MKVRAKQDGFYGGSRRRKGSEFEFSGKKPGSWMEPIDPPKSEKKASRSEAVKPEAEKPTEELI